MADLIQTSRDRRILRIALNRPDKRNALNVELCRQLVSALDEADRDPSVGAVLLTGNGKAFCAGMDLGEVLAAQPDEINSVHEQLFSLSVRLTIPIVAAIRGAALAGGTGLVANCHIAVAAEDAVFGLTEIRLGLWPFLIFRPVARAIGERRAIELALSGRTFGTGEAKDIGLVHEISPPGKVEERAAEVASLLSNWSPTALHDGLAFVHDIQGKDWRQITRIAQEARNRILRTPDFEEGVSAFLQKRQPKWPSLA